MQITVGVTYVAKMQFNRNEEEVLLSGMNWMRRRTPPPMTRNDDSSALLGHFLSSQVETT